MVKKVLSLNVLVALALGLTACENGRPATSEFDQEASGSLPGVHTCEEGETRHCSTPLPQHNGVVSCYSGIQVCEGGSFGECGNGEITTLALPSSVGMPGGRRNLLAVQLTDECADNPCSPTCRLFENVPDAGGLTTVEISGTSPFDWEAGSLSDFPAGLVNKGLKEPCSTGYDCQFNTACTFPSSGTCDHNKCIAGAALEAGCDSCVDDICALSPTCCAEAEIDGSGGSAPPTASCDQNLCEVGAASDPSCGVCVTQVCDADPTCCGDSWSASCVAAVASVCGLSCGCGAGEVEGSSSCYYHEESDLSWTDARASCQARGADWDLVAIEDATENNFVVSNVNDNSKIWMGLTDGNGIGWPWVWSWSSGDPMGSWNQFTGFGIYQNFEFGEPDDGDCAYFENNRTGDWEEQSCSQRYDSVCEGPIGTLLAGAGGMAEPTSGFWEVIPLGSRWSHYTAAGGPPSTWSQAGYDDSTWASAAAHFGFGDGDEATSLSRSDPSYYFRKTFTLSSEVSSAALNLVFDDGFVAYVNGTEVGRRNVGSVADSAWATAASDDNQTWSGSVDATLFEEGTNVLAIVVKNRSFDSSDISFDAALTLELCDGDCIAPAVWSEECAAMVDSVCDVTCDENAVPRAAGMCLPWYPGKVDETCMGVDLALGVPCGEEIPVCNHGTVEAPAGIRIVHFPGNSEHYPGCNPEQSDNKMKECVTTEVIPPGECITQSDCGLVGNREIMVNPPGATQVTECSCRDNWTLYHPGVDCAPPTCSGSTSIATLDKKPVDIIFVIDNSGSMQGEIFQVQERINSDFATIIQESGIDYRVIMMARYGDINTAVGDSNFPICVRAPLGGHDCSNPVSQGVGNAERFFHFSTDVQSRDALCRLLEGWKKPDELASDFRSWTPIAPEGYSELLRPEAYKEFVVITDDRVDCGYDGYSFDDGNSVSAGTNVAADFDRALLALSPEHFGSQSQRNYVFHSIVAMEEYSPVDQPWPATEPVNTGRCAPGSEAPGTGYQALSVLTGGLRYPTCRNDDFDAIFRALAEEIVVGSTASCSLGLSNVGAYDVSTTLVSFVPSDAATPIVLKQVASPAECVNDAYYYENAETITLCPNTCDAVQAAGDGKLSVEVGCDTTGLGPQTHSEIYQANCNFDEVPQWSFFTYDSTTPDDSQIAFRMRTAKTEAALVDQEWVDMMIADSASGTEICGPGGPAPCPVDIFDGLGGMASATRPFLELDMTFLPSTSKQAPTLNSWNLTYACPDAQ